MVRYGLPSNMAALITSDCGAMCLHGQQMALITSDVRSSEVLDDTFSDWFFHKKEIFWLNWKCRLYHDRDQYEDLDLDFDCSHASEEASEEARDQGGHQVAIDYVQKGNEIWLRYDKDTGQDRDGPERRIDDPSADDWMGPHPMTHPMITPNFEKALHRHHNQQTDSVVSSSSASSHFAVLACSWCPIAAAQDDIRPRLRIICWRRGRGRIPRRFYSSPKQETFPNSSR